MITVHCVRSDLFLKLVSLLVLLLCLLPCSQCLFKILHQSLTKNACNTSEFGSDLELELVEKPIFLPHWPGCVGPDMALLLRPVALGCRGEDGRADTNMWF